MASLNKVQLIGRLGAEPTKRSTQSGQVVVNLSLATSEAWKDQAGAKHEKTEWHRVVVWGKRAEVCAKYLQKGSMVYVEGRLETKKFNKNGVDHYSTDIVANEVLFLSKNNSDKPQDVAVSEFPPSEPRYSHDDPADQIPF